MDGRMEGGWMDGRMEGRMDEWMDGRMRDGWMLSYTDSVPTALT